MTLTKEELKKLESSEYNLEKEREEKELGLIIDDDDAFRGLINGRSQARPLLSLLIATDCLTERAGDALQQILLLLNEQLLSSCGLFSHAANLDGASKQAIGDQVTRLLPSRLFK